MSHPARLIAAAGVGLLVGLIAGAAGAFSLVMLPEPAPAPIAYAPPPPAPAIAATSPEPEPAPAPTPEPVGDPRCQDPRVDNLHDAGVASRREVALRRLRDHGYDDASPALIIDAGRSRSSQSMFLVRGGAVECYWKISTGASGLGFVPESHMTPSGIHRIYKKIGDGAPIGTVFETGIQTSRVLTDLTTNRQQEPEVLTRLMWLDGQERKNRNTIERNIYIHGTNREDRLGLPASDGCIRMANQAIVYLYDAVGVGTLVEVIDPYSEAYRGVW